MSQNLTLSESRWMLFRKAHNQADQCPVKRWVKLSTVWENILSSWALSGKTLSQAKKALSGKALIQSERCPWKRQVKHRAILDSAEYSLELSRKAFRSWKLTWKCWIKLSSVYVVNDSTWALSIIKLSGKVLSAVRKVLSKAERCPGSI